MSSSTRWAQEQEDDRMEDFAKKTKAVKQILDEGKVYIAEGEAVFDEHTQSVVVKYDGSVWFSSMFPSRKDFFGIHFKDKNGEEAGIDLVHILAKIGEPVVHSSRELYVDRFEAMEGFSKYV